MAEIKISPQQFLLIMLLLENTMAAVFNEVAEMTPEQVRDRTEFEEDRKKNLMAKVENH